MVIPLLALLSLLPAPQQPESSPAPKTRPEATGCQQTSTHADVCAFLAAVAGPRVVVREFGKTGAGQTLPFAIAAAPMVAPDGSERDSRLRVLIVANIHGGEVEGKEATQMLLRELAAGQHADLLQRLVLLVVPDFNADGNDRIDPKNRVAQNGPDGGVGRRENAAGLDLNRDFVKLESEEGQALVRLISEWEPQVLLDLHTTNGSHHGYHVTYATSQSPNAPRALADFTAQRFLPRLVAGLAQNHGLRAFPYGNLERDKDGPLWTTFDHRPRYLTNYFGVRGGLALLCEAYSYLPFAQRIAVTRAFVHEALHGLVETWPRAGFASPAAAQPFGFATELGPAALGEVLVGKVERVPREGLGTRLVASAEYSAQPMRVRTSFVATRIKALPGAYAVVGASAATLRVLGRHGLELQTLREAVSLDAEVFVPASVKRARTSFQKHLTTEVAGTWRAQRVQLPAGTLLVGSSLLAAQLLEPESEDSLGTWNHFDAALPRADSRAATAPEPMPYPVLRLATLPPPDTRLWQIEARGPAASRVHLQLHGDGSGEARRLGFALEGRPADSHAALAARLAQLAAEPRVQARDLASGADTRLTVELHAGAGVLEAEVRAVREMLAAQGFGTVLVCR